MAEAKKITREDIHLKARILSEGVRIEGLEMPSFREMDEWCDEPIPDKLNLDDIDEIMRLMAYHNRRQPGLRLGLRSVFKLDGSGLTVRILPNEYSRLEMTIDGDEAAISDGGEVLATGNFPKRPEWHHEKLSNGLPISTALPVMSAGIINIVFSLSCMNYNSKRGCRYCNLFANPVSRKIVMLPKETLKGWARYQGEAAKIAMDNGWRGSFAVSGGALPPAHQGEYLHRLEILLDTIREAVGEERFSESPFVYNHYPPEDFSDMNHWKEFGINATSIDLEVMDEAYFSAICPGKSAYKPHAYWKKAQEASVETFGPYLRTTGCIVVGIEPMSTLVKGIDERLSKGIMPLPLTFGSAPGSAYWGFRPPTADWLVEASEKMADSYMEHAPKFMRASAEAGDDRPGRRRAARSNPQSLVFDEIQRRVQKLLADSAQS